MWYGLYQLPTLKVTAGNNMARPNELTIADDSQLIEYGIFTEETAPADMTLLSRHDFQSIQHDVYDIFPTDEIFVLTLKSAIERHTGLSMRTDWGKQPQPATYICTRRPSEPHFLVSAQTANGILQESRYRKYSIFDSWDAETNKHRAYVLQSTLARQAINDLITMEVYEQPLRLTGNVFMTPKWRSKALQQNPFMITLADFKRYNQRPRINESLVNIVFRKLGIELLGEANTDTGTFATDYLQGNNWIDDPAGIFSYDLPAAAKVVAEQWTPDLDAGRTPAVFDSPDNYWSGSDAISSCITLAQTAISNKIPREWHNRKGEFAPPKREWEFDF